MRKRERATNSKEGRVRNGKSYLYKVIETTMRILALFLVRCEAQSFEMRSGVSHFVLKGSVL
jgi:hypothetical protein